MPLASNSIKEWKLSSDQKIKLKKNTEPPKSLKNVKYMTYKERLKALNLPSIKHRQLREDLMSTTTHIRHK